MKFRTLGLITGLGMLLAACTSAPPQMPGEAFTPITPEAQVVAMAGGVNVLGYDPVWSNPAEGHFKPYMFAKIKKAGFAHVRFVLFAFDHMDENNQLEAQWLKTLDTMVSTALDAGLIVILDEHDFDECSKDVEACRPKLNAFWKQIGTRYKDVSNRLVFEPLNEPHGELTPERWNVQLVETLAVIRASNPTRNVVIGPGYWNGLEHLPKLKLPEDDRHIIVTFHYYHPMEFTHQGARWVDAYRNLSGVRWGTPEEVAKIDEELDTVKAWSVAHNRPVMMGEFGALETGKMEDRVKWTAAVARSAERHGFAWGYWQFINDFVVYDLAHDQWVEPILHALIPPKK